MSLALNLALIERTARAVQDHFSVNQESYLAYLARSLDSPLFGSEAGMNALGAKLAVLPYVRMDYLAAEFASLQRAAVSDSGMSEAAIDRELSNMLRDRVRQLWEALAAQERRERAAVIAQYRNIALRVRRMRAVGHSLKSALIALRDPDNARVLYSFADRSGRAWDSLKYVRLHVRGDMISNYNESFLFGIALNWSETLAEVRHANPDHRNNALVFAHGEAREGLPSYDEIREKVFHPNAQALAARHIPRSDTISQQ